MTKLRPSREQIHMATAYLWAKRALCIRENRSVGCVITTEDMQQVLSIGYNGPPRQLQNNACTGKVGDCGCVHSEINAIIKVDGRLLNKIMFVTMAPCKDCAKAIAQANITKVFFAEDYRNKEGVELLRKCGIKVIHIKPFLF
jgi:dCMP deaminase